MRVLWFANSPCGATSKLTGKPIIGGGWLYSLSQELIKKESVELHIAFYWGKEVSPFELGGIIYHPILRAGDYSKFGRYLNRVKTQFSNAADDVEIKRCLNIIDDINPDVIHIHGSEDNFGLIAEHFDKSKIVLSVQGILNSIYLKMFSGYTQSEIKKSEGIVRKLMLEGISSDVRRIKRRVKREERIFKSINNIIGRTSWDRACSLALNPMRKYFVVNELMRDAFYRSKWEPQSNNNCFEIVTTVSNGLYKGVETIYKTARLLKDNNFEFSWKVIGINESFDIVRTTETITKLSADDLNLTFAGRKTADEIVSIMLESNLFVQVGHIENSPNSLCEAMMLGIPCLATFAGGTSSILEDKADGILIQDGDPYSMAGSIMEISSNYDVAIERGNHARERAMDRHSGCNVKKELLYVYNTMIKDNC